MAISVHDLSLRQLQYVVAVADTLGFHKAAETCHVSQPTLSAQVQQIEQVLGVQIFERDRRRVLLTLAGEEIVRRARRVLLEVTDLIDAAERGGDVLKSELRIGVIPTVAPYLLPRLTPAVRERHPALRLIFVEQKTEDVLRELGVGALDLGLLALEAELGEVAHATIAVDPFVVALPKGHRLAAKKRLRLADLTGEPVLLLDDGHCFRTQALSLCAQVGAEEAAFRATSLPTLAQMAASGLGLTLLPELSVPVENRQEQLDVRPFARPAPHRTIALIWRPTSPFGDAFEELARVMRRAVLATHGKA